MYDEYDLVEDRLAKCIRFELEHGGNHRAAARAVLRDIRLGYIPLSALAAAPPGEEGGDP